METDHLPLYKKYLDYYWEMIVLVGVPAGWGEVWYDEELLKPQFKLLTSIEVGTIAPTSPATTRRGALQIIFVEDRLSLESSPPPIPIPALKHVAFWHFMLGPRARLKRPKNGNSKNGLITVVDQLLSAYRTAVCVLAETDLKVEKRNLGVRALFQDVNCLFEDVERATLKIWTNSSRREQKAQEVALYAIEAIHAISELTEAGPVERQDLMYGFGNAMNLAMRATEALTQLEHLPSPELAPKLPGLGSMRSQHSKGKGKDAEKQRYLSLLRGCRARGKTMEECIWELHRKEQMPRDTKSDTLTLKSGKKIKVSTFETWYTEAGAPKKDPA